MNEIAAWMLAVVRRWDAALAAGQMTRWESAERARVLVFVTRRAQASLSPSGGSPS